MSPLSPDITQPKDPAAYRRPGRSPRAWALVAFGAACVLLGVAIALLAPRLWAGRQGPPTRAAPALSEPAAVAAVPLPPAAPAAAAAGAQAPAELDRLDARVSALESHETRTSQAASAALAAAALVEATQDSGPFSQELAALRAAAPDTPELAALSRVADVGAPTRAALAASFPDYAARAVSAGRAPETGAGLGARILYLLSRIVTIRRVGDVPGDSADARLAKAERLVEDGDLDRALRVLDHLSDGPKQAMAPWRLRAERRAEIDRQAAALRVRALQDLARASRGGA